MKSISIMTATRAPIVEQAQTRPAPKIPRALGWLAVIGAGLAGGVFLALQPRRELRGVQPDPRPHYAQKKRKAGHVFFVDPESGDVIELDHNTAKYRRQGETEFRGARWEREAIDREIKRIASTSRTAAEYARRIEAWNAAEAKPQSITRLARAWAGGRQGPQVSRLIREAEATRLTERERRNVTISHGLRGRRKASADDSRWHEIDEEYAGTVQSLVDDGYSIEEARASAEENILQTYPEAVDWRPRRLRRQR